MMKKYSLVMRKSTITIHLELNRENKGGELNDKEKIELIQDILSDSSQGDLDTLLVKLLYRSSDEDVKTWHNEFSRREK
jgi:hypothetical protein